MVRLYGRPGTRLSYRAGEGFAHSPASPGVPPHEPPWALSNTSRNGFPQQTFCVCMRNPAAACNMPKRMGWDSKYRKKTAENAFFPRDYAPSDAVAVS